MALAVLKLTMIGKCHCARVVFEVRVKPTVAFTCNCSYCIRRGWNHAYAEVGDFALVLGKDVLSSYRFGAGATTNYFCSVCGIHTHFYSTYGDHPRYAYCLGCCEEIDIASLEIKHIDGRSF
jgi:hypothetical protein